MKPKFFECRHCGNIVEMVRSSGVSVFCCGEKMQELVPNSSEGAGEKHLPDVFLDGDVLSVNVGSVDHPMTENHLIEWIYVATEKGSLKKQLKFSDKPFAKFRLEEKPLAVYSFCNLHGLWMTEI